MKQPTMDMSSATTNMVHHAFLVAGTRMAASSVPAFS